MELTHVKEGENLIITIKGRLDAASAPVADTAIKKIMEEDCPRILFNLNDLEYLSSGGLRVILGVAKELKRKQQFPLIVRRPKNRAFWNLCFVNF